MLHVNDDSNDELFRKAAADYFLGANNPDFGAFNNRMDDGVAASATETNSKKEKQRRYYWIPGSEWFFYTPVHKAVSVLRNFLQGRSKKKISVRFYADAYVPCLPVNSYFQFSF